MLDCIQQQLQEIPTRQVSADDDFRDHENV